MANDGWNSKWPVLFPQQLIKQDKRDGVTIAAIQHPVDETKINTKWDLSTGTYTKHMELSNSNNPKAIDDYTWPTKPLPVKGEDGKIYNYKPVLKDNWLTHESDQFAIDNWPTLAELNGLTDKPITNLPISEKTAIRELKSQGSNLVDNEAYLYFQCEGCNEILDPNTKSFAKLQEHRVNAGWKCVWNLNGQGYKVYCEKCGEKV